MDHTTIQLDLPHDLVTLLDVPSDQLGEEVLLLAVLELVREEHISTGKAAELFGLSKADMIDRMAQRGIPYFTETPEELAAQLDALGDLGDESDS